MPSHAYFFASDNVPEWDKDAGPDTTQRAERRRAIADAILAAFPGMEEQRPYGPDDTWISLWIPGLEITVYHDFLHLRLRWRSHAEMEELGLVDNLHRLARVVDRAVGFDFFEHGCQGLGRRGDIDLVPDVIAGSTRKLRTLFGVAQEQPVFPRG